MKAMLVYEMVMDSTSQELFGGFGLALDSLALTQAQIKQFGVSPTKVRKVPQDSCQLPGRKGFSAIPELPRRDLV